MTLKQIVNKVLKEDNAAPDENAVNQQIKTAQLQSKTLTDKIKANPTIAKELEKDMQLQLQTNVAIEQSLQALAKENAMLKQQAQQNQQQAQQNQQQQQNANQQAPQTGTAAQTPPAQTSVKTTLDKKTKK